MIPQLRRAIARLPRWGWFILIYGLSLAVVAAVAYGLRALLKIA